MIVKMASKPRKVVYIDVGEMSIKEAESYLHTYFGVKQNSKFQKIKDFFGIWGSFYL